MSPRVQRHTVEHIVDIVRVAPMVQILDALVPHMVEQLQDVLQFFADAEQVIDVPKISFEDIPTRTLVRDPQLAEQLVEVPTFLCFLKQTVDIPVPRGRGRRLQGFSQNSVFLLLVERDLQVSRPGQGSTASSSSSVSHSPADELNTADEAFECFFRTLPRPKKSATRAHPR